MAIKSTLPPTALNVNVLTNIEELERLLENAKIQANNLRHSLDKIENFKLEVELESKKRCPNGNQ